MNKAKKIILLFAVVSMFVIGGCSSVQNTTPERVPENNSRSYKLTMDPSVNELDADATSHEGFIVIDGKTLPMKEVVDDEGKRHYEYNYILPRDRTSAKYYFILKYNVPRGADGKIYAREAKSEIHTLRPYAHARVTMTPDHGNVGSTVTLLGRGFNANDKVYVGDVKVETESITHTNITFLVPMLDSEKRYNVEVRNESGDTWVGEYHVDVAQMGVSPSEIEVVGGEITTMIFNIGFSAPKGGFPIDVKTNIPNSIVMEEVVVPEGQTSVSISIKGAAEGKGSIYVKGAGFGEKVVPVAVKKADSKDEVVKNLSAAAKETKAPERKEALPAKKEAAQSQLNEEEVQITIIPTSTDKK